MKNLEIDSKNREISSSWLYLLINNKNGKKSKCMDIALSLPSVPFVIQPRKRDWGGLNMSSIVIQIKISFGFWMRIWTGRITDIFLTFSHWCPDRFSAPTLYLTSHNLFHLLLFVALFLYMGKIAQILCIVTQVKWQRIQFLWKGITHFTFKFKNK